MVCCCCFFWFHGASGREVGPPDWRDDRQVDERLVRGLDLGKMWILGEKSGDFAMDFWSSLENMDIKEEVDNHLYFL